MAGPLLYDRVKETTTTTGAGTLTLAGAVSGFRSFSAVGNGNTCYYCIDGGTEWEVGIGTYTSSGTTLSRDKVLASSNSGSAVSLSAGSKTVFLTAPASILLPELLCQGRLTTESGVPVSTSDRTAQSTIYFTPYNGNRVALWNGSGWQLYAFSEVSLALSGLTSGKNYDVFLYDNAGTLTLELSAAWTNDTTRADALTTQDGVSVKSGALTRRHLGTIRTTGTTTTEDSGGGSSSQVGGKRFVWNRYNQVSRRLAVIDTTTNWSYNSATARQWNNAAGNKVEYVTGDAATLAEAEVINFATGGYGIVGVGVDSTSAMSGLRLVPDYKSTNSVNSGLYKGQPGLGYHYLAALEAALFTATITFGGSDATGPGSQTGMYATIQG